MAEERTGHTLSATALVHETFVRLGAETRFASRSHFFHAAAETMRRILIDHARQKKAVRRGGKLRRLPASLLDFAAAENSAEILALEEAISRLERQAPLAAAIVRLRFYTGLSVEETAAAVNVSPRTVNREWTFARAWLYRALADDATS